jgi:DNA-binding MarR family transcriptional regulator
LTIWSGELIIQPYEMQPAREIPLPGLLSISQELVQAELFSRLREAGYPELRPTHGCVFGTIGPEGDRLTSLAQRADMTKQAVGEVVSELQAIGYVERVPDPSDGRAKVIRLTERGLSAWELGTATLAEIQQAWEQRYGSERVRDMVALLTEIVDDAEVAADDRAVA